MKPNETIHITIKKPPDPNPVRSLGVFDDPDNPNILRMIELTLAGVTFEPKDNEFKDNVKDEVLKLLAEQKVIGAMRKNNITCVFFQR